jgi:hypothetical protein
MSSSGVLEACGYGSRIQPGAEGGRIERASDVLRGRDLRIQEVDEFGVDLNQAKGLLWRVSRTAISNSQCVAHDLALRPLDPEGAQHHLRAGSPAPEILILFRAVDIELHRRPPIEPSEAVDDALNG